MTIGRRPMIYLFTSANNSSSKGKAGQWLKNQNICSQIKTKVYEDTNQPESAKRWEKWGIYVQMGMEVD